MRTLERVSSGNRPDLGPKESALEALGLGDPRILLGWNLSEGQPWNVRLAAWAEDQASELHARFPDLLITVGFLRYPERTPSSPVDLEGPFRGLPTIDSGLTVVDLDGPLRVESGHTAHHALAVRNLDDQPLVVKTNGRVTAHVLDPATQLLVGISVEIQHLPLVRFEVPPRETITVPLWLGTASVEPSLGYAVPLGVWQARAKLSLSIGDFLTPALPFEIIPCRSATRP